MSVRNGQNMKKPDMTKEEKYSGVTENMCIITHNFKPIKLKWNIQ